MKILNRSIIILLLFTLLVHPNYSQEVDYNYKSTVQTFNEAWNTGNYDLLDEVVHPEYLKLEGDLKLKGIEPLKEFIQDYRESYKDVKIIYTDEVYGREKAAIKFTIDGTPKETGKRFKAEGIVIFHFRDGKIIKDHSVFDQLSALKQQGYIIIEPE
jgi:ketosteroid isomerase-like protein